MNEYILTDSEIIARIGEVIRKSRLEKNISLKMLAKDAGVSLSSVAGIEQGKSISVSTLIPLLRALDLLSALAYFLEKPQISPVAYAKILDGQNKRKRASVRNKTNIQTESEW